MTRAVMEGVVFSLRDSLELLRSLDVQVEDVRATGGGAKVASWRQLQADIFNMPIHRTTIDEGPAFGAALLAGVAAGVYTSVNEATVMVELRNDVTLPDPERVKVYEDHYDIYTFALCHYGTRDAPALEPGSATGSATRVIPHHPLVIQGCVFALWQPWGRSRMQVPPLDSCNCRTQYRHLSWRAGSHPYSDMPWLSRLTLRRLVR